MWETILKEYENGKTTTGFGRKQSVNDTYKTIFISTEKLRFDFFLIKGVKFHFYILNINYTISVVLFMLYNWKLFPKKKK